MCMNLQLVHDGKCLALLAKGCDLFGESHISTTAPCRIHLCAFTKPVRGTRYGPAWVVIVDSGVVVLLQVVADPFELVVVRGCELVGCKVLQWTSVVREGVDVDSGSGHISLYKIYWFRDGQRETWG